MSLTPTIPNPQQLSPAQLKALNDLQNSQIAANQQPGIVPISQPQPEDMGQGLAPSLAQQVAPPDPGNTQAPPMAGVMPQMPDAIPGQPAIAPAPAAPAGPNYLKMAADQQAKINPNVIHPHGIRKALNIAAGIGVGAATFNPIAGIATSRMLNRMGPEGDRLRQNEEYGDSRDSYLNLAKQDTSDDKVAAIQANNAINNARREKEDEEKTRVNNERLAQGDRRATNLENRAQWYHEHNDASEDYHNRSLDERSQRDDDLRKAANRSGDQRDRQLNQGDKRIANGGSGTKGNGLSVGANRTLKADDRAQEAHDGMARANHVINNPYESPENKATAEQQYDKWHKQYSDVFHEYVSRDQKGEWGTLATPPKKTNPYPTKTTSSNQSGNPYDTKPPQS